ncbi:HEPN domain-containing protein [Pseudomonas sp. B21-048]|uniref:HEPN domain-containing protein n=1 Tax=Pseudomonas sp. B21-048 TaxID=2895490 RepID=UPI00215E22C1|nr:HEPN domain-containing protein [Pseudomonas sp. B21-048]UVK96423.1 hypothetical protein LOY56_13410 [Pseudomonas sp. B21-048]
MNDTGFAIVLNNLQIADDLLPFEISESAVIRRATHFEAEHYKFLLKAAGQFSTFIVDHGSEVKKVETTPGSFHNRYVPPESSQLLVVETTEYNRNIQSINMAGKLTRFQFRVGGHAGYAKDSNKKAVSMHQGFNSYELDLLQDFTHKGSISIPLNELQELRGYYVKINDNSKPVDRRINRAITIYHDIDTLPFFSELRTLSYFAVLECLLTRQDASGAALSIQKQLQRKTELLCNYIGFDTQNTKFFKPLGIKKLWEKLYALRSSIAHGNIYDIRIDAPELIDLQTVNSFMEQLVREMLRTAIDQYQLVADLREC